MKLRVLNVAYPFAPVGPDAVGGAEQILTYLDNVLVRKGHQSLVVACEGSRTFGPLYSITQVQREIDDSVRHEIWTRQRETIERVLASTPIDLIHMHGVDFYRYLPKEDIPVLVTLHLPPTWYPREIFQFKHRNIFLHCVSKSQERACPPEAELLPVIENGVPNELFESRHAKRRFAVSLGRICPEKGFHIALDAARMAKMPLVLAGETFPYESHQRFLAREIKPRLDHHRLFIGPIGLRRKRRLLSAARCLIAPSLVPETSSLVAMEALACGTPVVAFPNGALADIIEHGKTGFLVTDQREMASAIRSANFLDPNLCRESARQRFSMHDMVSKYLNTYENIVAAMRNNSPEQLEIHGNCS